MFGPAFGPNLLTYAALGAVTYLVMLQANLIKNPEDPVTPIAEAPFGSPSANQLSQQAQAQSTLGETTLGTALPVSVPDELRLPDAPLFLNPDGGPVNTAEADAPLFESVVPNPQPGESPGPITDAPVFR